MRGNTRTRDYVVRREFDLAEGDAFNRVLIDRAERRLQRLGYFSDVRIFTEPGSSDDRVIVVVQVVEQPTGEFSFGVGYSTGDGVVGDVSLTERNFLGRGYNLRVAVGGGTNSRSYEFGFTDPYFLGRRISAGVNVYRRIIRREQLPLLRLRDDRRRPDVRLPDHRGFHRPDRLQDRVPGNRRRRRQVRLRRDADDDDNVSRAICQAEGETLVSSVLYSLIYDTLDSRTDPHDGIYAKFTQEFAGVGGDVTLPAHDRHARPTIASCCRIATSSASSRCRAATSSASARTCACSTPSSRAARRCAASRAPASARATSATGDALGGNIYAAGTAEVQFPLPVLPRELGFKGAFFADAGTLFDTDFTTPISARPASETTMPRSAPRSAARSSGLRRSGRSAPTSPMC